MPDLARVVIQPFRDGIRMSGPSGVTLYDCFGDPGKTLKLQGGDTFEIICSVGRMKGRQVQLSGVYDSRTERNG